MNILIVDDEMIAIEGIIANVAFDQYGIEKVFTANSMEQAKVIIQGEKTIDIMICDIEMPNGSGLELIGWMNSHYPDIASVILSCHNEFEFAQQAVSLSCLKYILKPATPDILADTLKKAVLYVEQRAAEGKIKKLGEEYIQKIAETKEEDINAVEKVRRYIVEHIQEDLVVEKLAQMVYLSQNHLTRSFKRKYGKTVMEYITDCRLSLAEELLQSTDLTVTMVSAKAGYSNYAYFSKLFKKHCGYTPTQYQSKYRRQYKNPDVKRG